MSSRFLSFTIAAGIAVMAAGCGARSPAGPSSVAAEPPAPIAVAGVSPAVGSTSGSTPVKIAGSGFQTGAIVTIDGLTIPAAVANDRATIRFRTPPHPAGVVELIVTNPDGGEAKLAGAYVYVPPASFDFDGEWAGAAADLDLRFTVQDGALVSVSCGASGPIAFLPAPAINEGAFSIVAADGTGISARIVSASDAVGTINLAPCRSMNWTAKRLT